MSEAGRQAGRERAPLPAKGFKLETTAGPAAAAAGRQVKSKDAFFPRKRGREHCDLPRWVEFLAYPRGDWMKHRLSMTRIVFREQICKSRFFKLKLSDMKDEVKNVMMRRPQTWDSCIITARLKNLKSKFRCCFQFRSLVAVGIGARRGVARLDMAPSLVDILSSSLIAN